jgi:hypothetical protein
MVRPAGDGAFGKLSSAMNNDLSGERRSMGGRRVCRAVVAATLGVAAWLASGTSQAQERPKRFELGVYGGYLFGNSIEGHSAATLDTPALTSKASIGSAAAYGATIDLAVRRGAYAELSYFRQATDLSLRISDGSQYRYDLLVQYLQIGGLLEFRTPGADWLRPIFGGTIGAAIYSADDGGFKYEEGAFAMIFEGGAKIRLTDFLGLRVRGRLLGTFITDQSALLCVSGGCAFAYSGSVLVQGEVGGGAYVTF